jgi:hypothetical protein
MDVQAPVCVFLSHKNGEGGLAGIRAAFAARLRLYKQPEGRDGG